MVTIERELCCENVGVVVRFYRFVDLRGILGVCPFCIKRVLLFDLIYLTVK